MRILLVEDDGLIRMTTASMLQELGHDVWDVADGEGALAVLPDLAIDLLITDVNLPGLSGRDVARIAIKRAPGLRVIFATGSSVDLVGEDFASCSALLSKPYGERELRSAIAAVLKVAVA